MCERRPGWRRGERVDVDVGPLTPGTSWIFRVRALNVCGWSPFSPARHVWAQWLPRWGDKILLQVPPLFFVCVLFHSFCFSILCVPARQHASIAKLLPSAFPSPSYLQQSVRRRWLGSLPTTTELRSISTSLKDASCTFPMEPSTCMYGLHLFQRPHLFYFSVWRSGGGR